MREGVWEGENINKGKVLCFSFYKKRLGYVSNCKNGFRYFVKGEGRRFLICIFMKLINDP